MVTPMATPLTITKKIFIRRCIIHPRAASDPLS